MVPWRAYLFCPAIIEAASGSASAAPQAFWDWFLDANVISGGEDWWLTIPEILTTGIDTQGFAECQPPS